MLAALGCHTDCVHILLEKGAKADAGDKKGFTALHRAVCIYYVVCLCICVSYHYFTAVVKVNKTSINVPVVNSLSHQMFCHPLTGHVGK